MRKLNTYVHVHDGEGNTRVFGPDDDVPADMAKLITNPAVWQSNKDDQADDEDEAGSRSGRRRATS
ncbi:hypothetical protein NDR87_30925 [Nocardia sp. CDC159]|uniref:Uncharacterized protein n=1 Tax=Nocardia pulmonis TaxID=2951408 RepID=A0A9X2EGQ5_9NOCA|nr:MULTISPECIES: hypothetical protein [Nocardia]MCM6778036.1 hypothetical protein [Nocardia pulmonis]MCM6790793.1 hypothetical protein [Nocardia sp. CDC159]